MFMLSIDKFFIYLNYKISYFVENMKFVKIRCINMINFLNTIKNNLVHHHYDYFHLLIIISFSLKFNFDP